MRLAFIDSEESYQIIKLRTSFVAKDFAHCRTCSQCSLLTSRYFGGVRSLSVDIGDDPLLQLWSLNIARTEYSLNMHCR